MIEKKQLTQLVKQGKSYRSIAEILGCSLTTVRYWANKYELKKPDRKYCCSYCGTKDKKRFASGRYTACRKCRTTDEKDRYLKKKKIAVEQLGGKCCKCGYNKNLAALDFHHRDSKQKDPDFKKLRHRSLKVYLNEVVGKCDLVCKNCHAEIHYPEYN